MGRIKDKQTTMNFGQAFRCAFEHPKWMQNIALAAVCTLIPIVGFIVLMGYFAQCFLAWLDKRQYPEFDFNLFGKYLETGVWPFLVYLVWSMILAPIIALVMIVGFPIMALFMDVQGGSEVPILAILFFFVLMAAVFVIQLAFTLFLLPAMLNAKLRQSFQAGFDFGFILSFVRKMVGPLLIYAVVSWAVMLAAFLVGYAAACVGIYFTLAWFMFFAYRLEHQLYEMYLERGGEEIPISPKLRAVPAPKSTIPPVPPPSQPLPPPAA